MVNYGLAAAGPVRWLVSSDKGVFDAVRLFIAGAGRDQVDVAGPPTQADMRLYQKKREQVVPLPCVRLKLKMIRHHLTGEPGVFIDVSDHDLEEISRWRRLKARGSIGKQ